MRAVGVKKIIMFQQHSKVKNRLRQIVTLNHSSALYALFERTTITCNGAIVFWYVYNVYIYSHVLQKALKKNI